MGVVILDISMSLDGFIAGLHDNPNNPLGDNGMLLHKWAWDDETGTGLKEGAVSRNHEIFNELHSSTGAVIVGRRTYDIVNGWNGTHPAHGVPVFVLTDDTPEDVPQGKSIFTFVTDGAERAVRQAKEVAGDKNVYVVGGANIAQQCIKQELLDEIQIHLASVLLGDGISLFDHLGAGPIQMEKIRVVDGPNATHLRYRFESRRQLQKD